MLNPDSLGSQADNNPYNRQIERCLASGFSAAKATETVLRSYIDGSPKSRGKQKLSRAALDAAFWSSELFKGIADGCWTSELMVLALTRYLSQERTSYPEVLQRAAAVAPDGLIRAVRYSSLVLRPQSARRAELDLVAGSDPKLTELCAVLEIFAKAHRARLAELDRKKAVLSSLTAFELLLYASLYAFEHLVPTTFESKDSPAKLDDAVELAWGAINDLLIWKLRTGTIESLALNDDKIGRSIKTHLSPSLFPDAGYDTRHQVLCRAFDELMAAQIELNEFVSSSADVFSYDDGVRFIRLGDRLEIEEIDASVQEAWDRESRKLDSLHWYWFNRAVEAFTSSDLITQRMGRPENEGFNRVAYIRSMQTHLRLSEIYGVSETVTTEAGEQVDLFQALLSLDLMSAFFLRDVLAAFTQHLKTIGHWRAALGFMAMQGLRNGMENRFPLTWSDRDSKVDNIIGWTVCREHPQGSKRAAAAILDFWTNDVARFAEKLQCDEPGLYPELFERPVLRFGKSLVQLPWVVGMQNNSSAAINNLRRLGARRGETKHETHQIEAHLGQLFQARGFRVAFNWEPPEKEAGEVDLICVRDGLVLVLELKSTFIRRSQRQAWQHASTTLRKAGQQLQRKVVAVEKAIADLPSLRATLGLSRSDSITKVAGWIVDTSIERDHRQFEGFLKVSVEEIHIALRDDKRLLHYRADKMFISDNGPDDQEGMERGESSLYPKGFNGNSFFEVIRAESIWDS